jgi:hypothetical protein
MSITTGKVLPTPGAALPFKVVFYNDGEIISELAVNSRLSGEELLTALLPTLQDIERL